MNAIDSWKTGREKKSRRNPVTNHPSIVGGLGIALTAFLVQQGLDPDQAANWSQVLIEFLIYTGIGGVGSGFIWAMVKPLYRKD